MGTMNAKRIFLKDITFFFIFLVLLLITKTIPVHGQISLDTLVTSTPDFIVIEPDPESQKLQFLTTTTDLSAAGFSAVVEQKPSRDRFQIPVQYFRVAQISNAQDALLDCSDCAQLVAVYVTPQIVTSSPRWAIEHNPFIDKVGGRVRIKLFAAQRVIFIIAPEQAVALKLAERLRERVILNKTLIDVKQQSKLENSKQ